MPRRDDLELSPVLPDAPPPSVVVDENAAVTHLRPSLWPLVAIGAAATALRVCNLGTFSMWLDEVLIMDRARGSLTATWAACAANAEHPPLAALVMSVGRKLGLGESGQRLIPIALGVATVLLLAHWTATHFGRRAGLLAGWLAAVSPLGIRYSQELRPYPYLLFFAVLTLVAVDRLMQRPGLLSTGLCGAAMVGGLYSHILYPLVWVAVTIVFVARLRHASPGDRARLPRAAALLGGAAAVSLAAYVPWAVASLRTIASRPAAGGVAVWTWHSLGERWEFLTVAARAGDRLSLGGLLVLVAVLVGCLRAVRSAAGVAALATVLLGTAGVELVLAAAGHWSNGRYDLLAWPFLLVLAALGLDRLFALGPRHLPALTALLAISLVSLHGVAEYQRIGRPSWDRLAEVIRTVRHGDEPLVVENTQCAISLGHYLDREIGGGSAMVDAQGQLTRLLESWPPGRSCLLVVGRLPAAPALREIAEHALTVVEYFSTARLCRLPASSRDTISGDRSVSSPSEREGSAWPPSSLVLLPAALQGQPRSCFARLHDALTGGRGTPNTERLDFDRATTADALVAGWSTFEHRGDGTTFVWARGREAGVRFFRNRPAPLILKVRLWPFAAPGRTQQVRALVDGSVPGEVPLRRGSQVVSLEVPAALQRAGENLLVLQFAYAVAPAEVRPASADHRLLAAAVDWVSFEEAQRPRCVGSAQRPRSPYKSAG